MELPFFLRPRREKVSSSKVIIDLCFELNYVSKFMFYKLY